jgi:hypothetical protein
VGEAIAGGLMDWGYNQRMRALVHMLMVVLAITALIAPASLCNVGQQMDHACCAPHAQLTTQCCSSSAAPVPTMPNQRNSSAEIGYLRTPLLSLIMPVSKVSRGPGLLRTAAIPILLPATILRT